MQRPTNHLSKDLSRLVGSPVLNLISPHRPIRPLYMCLCDWLTYVTRPYKNCLTDVGRLNSHRQQVNSLSCSDVFHFTMILSKEFRLPLMNLIMLQMEHLMNLRDLLEMSQVYMHGLDKHTCIYRVEDTSCAGLSWCKQQPVQFF